MKKKLEQRVLDSGDGQDGSVEISEVQLYVAAYRKWGELGARNIEIGIFKTEEEARTALISRGHDHENSKGSRITSFQALCIDGSYYPIEDVSGPIISIADIVNGTYKESHDSVLLQYQDRLLEVIPRPEKITTNG